MSNLNSGENDSLVVLEVGVVSEQVHGVHAIARVQIVEARDERLLTNHLGGVIGRERRDHAVTWGREWSRTIQNGRARAQRRRDRSMVRDRGGLDRALVLAATPVASRRQQRRRLIGRTTAVATARTRADGRGRTRTMRDRLVERDLVGVVVRCWAAQRRRRVMMRRRGGRVLTQTKCGRARTRLDYLRLDLVRVG